jgi:PmbA protein
MDIHERIEKEEAKLKIIVNKALDYVEKKHVDQALISVVKSTGLTTSVRNQETNEVKFSKRRDFSVTIWNDHHKGSASTTDLCDGAIFSTLDAAIDISKHTESDIYNGLADDEDLQREFTDFDTFYPEEPNPEAQIARSMELEKMCISHEKIKQCNSASVNSGYGQSIFATTEGQFYTVKGSYFSDSISLTAEENDQMEQGGSYHFTYTSRNRWKLEDMMKEALNETIPNLGAQKIQTQTLPVIFDKDVSPNIFYWLISGLEGQGQYKKTSYLNDCLGETILPEWLTVLEDPYMMHEMASSCVDSSGSKTIKRDIVTNGKVASYILSAYSARQLKMKNTGNGNGTYNWLVTNSGISRKELEKKMDTGLIIKDMMGFGLDPLTGDVSVGVRGLMVEHGEVTYPVKEITIAGNAREMLKNIVAISNDIDPESSIKTGSILIDAIKIAGK